MDTRLVAHICSWHCFVHPDNAQADFGEAVVVEEVQLKGRFLAMDLPTAMRPS